MRATLLLISVNATSTTSAQSTHLSGVGALASSNQPVEDGESADKFDCTDRKGTTAHELVLDYKQEYEEHLEHQKDQRVCSRKAVGPKIQDFRAQRQEVSPCVAKPQLNLGTTGYGESDARASEHHANRESIDVIFVHNLNARTCNNQYGGGHELSVADRHDFASLCHNNLDDMDLDEDFPQYYPTLIAFAIVIGVSAWAYRFSWQNSL